MIKRRLLYASIIVGVVLLQGALSPYIVIYGGTINLPAILVVCLALHHGAERGMYLGLVTGLLADIVVGGSIGFMALPLAVIGFAAGQLGTHLSKDAFVVPVIAGMLSVVFFEVSLFILYRLAHGFFLIAAFRDGFLARILLNGALMPLAIHLVNRVIPRPELELR
ncbi:MAG TPA: rod shape-determining protein MreD [Bacillota bacterium]|nr:rod shape-determining protein MreD [Bacillota bacterium]